jgi:hypothetical protein
MSKDDPVSTVSTDPAFIEKCRALALLMADAIPDSTHPQLLMGALSALCQSTFMQMVKLGYRTRAFEDFAYVCRQQIELQERDAKKAAKKEADRAAHRG